MATNVARGILLYTVRVVGIVIIVRRVIRVGRVGRVQGSRSLHICHKKYSVWALDLKAIRL